MREACCRIFGWSVNDEPGIVWEKNKWLIVFAYPNSYEYSEDELIFCPFCGKKLEDGPVESIKKYMDFGSSMNFWCPKCNAGPDAKCLDAPQYVHDERRLIHTSTERSKERFSQTQIVKVFNICGRLCLAHEEAKKLYNIVLSAIENKKKVHLDFSGVEVTASYFFNRAFGDLCKDFSLYRIKEFLTWFVDKEEFNELILHCLDMCSDFYSKDAETRKRIEELLQQDPNDY